MINTYSYGDLVEREKLFHEGNYQEVGPLYRKHQELSTRLRSVKSPKIRTYLQGELKNLELRIKTSLGRTQ